MDFYLRLLTSLRYRTYTILKKRKKSIPTLVGILLLMIGILSGLLLISRRQIFVQKAAPNTTLNLIPSTNNLKVGDSFSVFVNIDTGSNTFIGAELYLDIEPVSLLEITDITSGDFLPVTGEEVKSIDNSVGKIEDLVYLIPGSEITPLKGKGTLAVIWAKVLKEGSVTISFNPKSQTATSDEDAGQNLLASAESLQILINSDRELTETSAPISLTPTGISEKKISPTLTPGKSELPKVKKSPTTVPTDFPSPVVFDEPGREDEENSSCVDFGYLFLVIRRLGRDVNPGTDGDFTNDGQVSFTDLFAVLGEIKLRCN